MEIENKYFDLINVLVYDKRIKMSGIISEVSIIKFVTGQAILYYRAFMNKTHSEHMIFVDDIEKGNVVFLLPFGVAYKEKEMELMAEEHEKRIKEFFGDKFREDMIMRISEEERQEELRRWKEMVIGLENWDRKFEAQENKEESDG